VSYLGDPSICISYSVSFSPWHCSLCRFIYLLTDLLRHVCVFCGQTNEIVNTAVLTGVVQSYPMTVYSVSHAGHVADVTSQATCHAGDADILQVTTCIIRGLFV